MNKKNLLFFIIILFITLIVVILALLIVSLSNQSKTTENILEDGPTSYFLDNVTTTESDLLLNANRSKFFFTKDNDIFYMDLDTYEEVRLTNYENKEGPNINIVGINIIDDSKIGFGLCSSSIGDYGCGIYSLNLNTLVIKEIFKLNKDSLLLNLSFFSLDKFAFLYNLDNDLGEYNSWIFSTYNNGEIKLIDYPYTAFGRGFHPEDSQKVSFSKDGKNLFYIGTSSPIDMFDSNIYLYNLADETETIIQNATQPIWLNNSEIIFRRYNSVSNLAGYLYKYNLNTGQASELLGVPQSAYNPQLINEHEIIYSDYVGRSVWQFDLSNNQKTELINRVVDAQLIGERSIFYTEAIECEGKENCGGLRGEFELGSRKILNWENNTTRTLDSSWSNAEVFSN